MIPEAEEALELSFDGLRLVKRSNGVFQLSSDVLQSPPILQQELLKTRRIRRDL